MSPSCVTVVVMSTAHVTCPLCEATCGLEVTFDGQTVTGARGDAADVFSAGFVCPKGASLGQLHHDPDSGFNESVELAKRVAVGREP